MSSHVRLKKAALSDASAPVNPLGLTHVTSKVTGHYPRLAEGLSLLGLSLLRLFKVKKK